MKIKCDHFVCYRFFDIDHFLLLIAFDGFWEFWFFSVGLSALELGVGLACLDLRGSRDFLPFGSGPSKIIVLDLIYTLEVATEMSHLCGHQMGTPTHEKGTIRLR